MGVLSKNSTLRLYSWVIVCLAGLVCDICCEDAIINRLLSFYYLRIV